MPKLLQVKRVDLWDGGKRHNFGYYIDASVADDTINKHSQYCIITKHNLIIFDSITDKIEYNSKAKREAILAKLTTEEKVILGLL